jgi:hypothetical protein
MDVAAEADPSLGWERKRVSPRSASSTFRSIASKHRRTKSLWRGRFCRFAACLFLAGAVVLAAQPAQGAQLLAHLALLASPVDILHFAGSAYPGLGLDDRQALLEELDVAAALNHLLRFMTREAARFN